MRGSRQSRIDWHAALALCLQMVEELQTVVEQLQLDNRSLELENAKLKVQLVSCCEGHS